MPAPAPGVTDASPERGSPHVSSPHVAGPYASPGPALEVEQAASQQRLGEAAPAGACPEARPLRLDPTHPLFREQALRAYLGQHGIAGALRAETLGGWVMFACLLGCVVAALLIGAFAEVDLNAHARGVLQSPAGTALVQAAVDGIVTDVSVRLGQTVEANAPLLALDGRAAQAELLRARLLLEAAQARALREEELVVPLQQDALSLLQRRKALTRRRILSQGGEEGRLRSRRSTYEKLEQDGLISEEDRERVIEQFVASGRDKLALLDEQVALGSQVADVKRQEGERRASREQEVAQARAQLRAAELLVQQTVVRASRAGRVESLLVGRGDAIRPGMLVAQIVPLEAARSAVVFVPERDRAFLASGRAARIELDSLPRGEFGTLSARVERVARELAPPSELARYLGEDAARGAYVRIDLTLDPSLPGALTRFLESGAKLTARVPLRRRRLLSLVFEPLSAWLR